MTPLERLMAVTDHPMYQEFANELNDLRALFFNNEFVYAHLDGVARIMPRLREVARQLATSASVPVPAPPPEPEPEPEPEEPTGEEPEQPADSPLPDD